MASERLTTEENKSFWKSGLVKTAIVLVLAGVAFGITLNLING